MRVKASTRPSQRDRKQRGHTANGAVLQRNIAEVAAFRDREKRETGWQQRIADRLTAFSGSMSFVYLHAVWFGGWMLWNSGWFGVTEFDPPPFGLLTLIVSLEAIFLSTFVLISQNRQEHVSSQRAELDLHVNLLAERESTRTLQLLDLIAKKLEVEIPATAELPELEADVSAEEILRQLKGELKQQA